MITVGQPGPGTMGAPCKLISLTRAAGKLPMSTVVLPIAMPLGAGDTHTMPPGTELATAAGIPPMSTVGTAAAGVVGPPTWGLGPAVSGHTTVSPARSAGPSGTVTALLVAARYRRRTPRCRRWWVLGPGRGESPLHRSAPSSAGSCLLHRRWEPGRGSRHCGISPGPYRIGCVPRTGPQPGRSHPADWR